MVITTTQLLDCLDEIAPFAIAEPWDNVGLIVGDRSRPVRTILIGLDPTNRLIDEALQSGADTIITHHPAIFKPIPAIDTADPAGRFLENALSNRINVIACHTNFDSTFRGVNDALAELLHLEQVEPLVRIGSEDSDLNGPGRVGRYSPGRKRAAFVQLLLEALETDHVQMAGDLPETISTVALCGGSGSEFAESARMRGADVYISAEIKHHVGRWAEEIGFCIIDGSHYATEKPAVKLMGRRLRSESDERGWNLTIYETQTETHPFSMVDKNRYR
jgi:dinuclear metal center YbgI/SA1388 family protein